jgi:hypothetical protein
MSAIAVAATLGLLAVNVVCLGGRNPSQLIFRRRSLVWTSFKKLGMGEE